MLVARARALARATITNRFAHRWALIMQQKEAPEFTAKVAALESEQSAALASHTAELVGVVRDQRRLSRAWLKARQRAERRRVAESFRVNRYQLPLGRYPAFASADAIRGNRRRQVFALAGRIVTTRATSGFGHGVPRLSFRPTLREK